MQKCSICNKPLKRRLKNSLKHRKTSPPLTCPTCRRAKSKTYTCQICQRFVEESRALTHVKTEEYILNLIRKDHPQWKHDKKTCQQCLNYYRELIKKAQI